MEKRAKALEVRPLEICDSDTQETEVVWAQEAERRYEELRVGIVRAVPSQQVLEEARSRRHL